MLQHGEYVLMPSLWTEYAQCGRLPAEATAQSMEIEACSGGVGERVGWGGSSGGAASDWSYVTVGLLSLYSSINHPAEERHNDVLLYVLRLQCIFNRMPHFSFTSCCH